MDNFLAREYPFQNQVPRRQVTGLGVATTQTLYVGIPTADRELARSAVFFLEHVNTQRQGLLRLEPMSRHRKVQTINRKYQGLPLKHETALKSI